LLRWHRRRRLDTQSLTHAVLSAVRLGIIDLKD